MYSNLISELKRMLFVGLCFFIVAFSGCNNKNLPVNSQNADFLTVYGTVSYDEYKGGILSVFFKKELVRATPWLKNNVYKRNGPGSYQVMVPRSVGDFYICAKCTPPNNAENDSAAYFTSNKISMPTDTDSLRLDFSMEKKELLMDTYNGPVISISGTLRYDSFNNELLGIAVETRENRNTVYRPPDINHVFLERPGTYSILVPAGIGEVYINALSYPDKNIDKIAGDLPDVKFATYKKSPVTVKEENITNIDISLE